MDLKARIDINYERKDGRTENWTPKSHTAKTGVTKIPQIHYGEQRWKLCLRLTTVDLGYFYMYIWQNFNLLWSTVHLLGFAVSV